MLFIEKLKAQAVRNLVELQIEPEKQLNYFYGPNASGKTSILETIYLLSRVKSFRSKRINDVVSRNEKKLSVFARGMSNNKQFSIGIEKGRGITRLKYNGDTIQTASEQATHLPIYIITPDHHTLYTGTPKDRRHWLDWSLFHVEHAYLQIWKSYHKALRHRNALLKIDKKVEPKEISGWEKLMSVEAGKINGMRVKYLSDLESRINKNHINTVLPGEVRVVYQCESLGNDLEKLLYENRQKDAEKGYSSVGPHRSEIGFSFDEFSVAKHLSRGQTKLFGAAMVSAQVNMLKAKEINAIMLVDDIDAELDPDSSRKLLNLLLGNGVQTFVSSLLRQDWIPCEKGKHALFHVKHGQVEKVVE